MTDFDTPDWLQAALEPDAPFNAEAFAPRATAAAAATPARKSGSKPLIDLRSFCTGKGIKYTCVFLRCEFDSSEVKHWYRKPGNKWGKEAEPHCPKCGSAGALIGWDHDWSKEDRECAAWRKERDAYNEEKKQQRELRLKREDEAEDE